MSARVVIYTTAFCGYCTRARHLLERKGVAFEEVRVDTDPDRHREMTERSGRRTVPQVFIGDRHVGGCDDLYALERAGQLDPLIKQGNG